MLQRNILLVLYCLSVFSAFSQADSLVSIVQDSVVQPIENDAQPSVQTPSLDTVSISETEDISPIVPSTDSLISKTDSLPQIDSITSITNVTADSTTRQTADEVLLPDSSVSIVLKDTIETIEDSIQYVETPDSVSIEVAAPAGIKITDFEVDSSSTSDSIIADIPVLVTPNLKPAPVELIETVEEEIEVDKLLIVYVNDSTNHAGLKAKVRMTLINENAKNYTGAGVCNSKGEFKMFLNPDSKFILNTGCPNYTPRTDTFDLKDFESDTIELHLCLLKLEVGKVIRLAGVNFQQGKYELLTSSYPVLNNLVDLMKANPKMVIQLEGHTDNSGSKNASIKLSEERVNSVRFYMIQKGIKASRIKGVGYGGDKPLVNGSSPDALRMNRRVEFEILKM